MNAIYDEPYESFDLRQEQPERHQSVLNPPQPPPVKGDPVAVALVCACFVIACLLVGLVFVVPGQP